MIPEWGGGVESATQYASRGWKGLTWLEESLVDLLRTLRLREFESSRQLFEVVMEADVGVQLLHGLIDGILEEDLIASQQERHLLLHRPETGATRTSMGPLPPPATRSSLVLALVEDRHES